MAEIFVTQVTKCKDIVQRLQRQIQETDCYLIEVWQGCGRFGVIDAYLYKPKINSTKLVTVFGSSFHRELKWRYFCNITLFHAPFAAISLCFFTKFDVALCQFVYLFMNT